MVREQEWKLPPAGQLRPANNNVPEPPMAPMRLAMPVILVPILWVIGGVAVLGGSYYDRTDVDNCICRID